MRFFNLRILLRDVLYGILIGCLCLFILMIILMVRGPIEVPFLTNWVKSHISATYPDYEIDFDGLQLTWSGRYVPLALQAQSVSIRHNALNINGHIPLLRLEIEPAPLLTGNIELSDVLLESANINIDIANKGQDIALSNILALQILGNFTELDLKNGHILPEDWQTKLDEALTQYSLNTLKQFKLNDANIHFMQAGQEVGALNDISFILSQKDNGKRDLIFEKLPNQSDASLLKLGLHIRPNFNSRVHVEMKHLQPAQLTTLKSQFDEDTQKLISEMLANSTSATDPFEFNLESDLFITQKGNLEKLNADVRLLASKQILDFKLNSKYDQTEAQYRLETELNTDDFTPFNAISAPILKQYGFEFTLQGVLNAKAGLNYHPINGFSDGKLTLMNDRFILASKGLLVDQFPAPIALKNLSMTADYRDDQLFIQEMIGFVDHQPKDIKVSLSGTIEEMDTPFWQFNLSANMQDFDIRILPLYWPQDLLSPVRDWVINHAIAGKAPNAEIFTSFTYAKGEQQLHKLDSVHGSIHFIDGSLNYLDAAPIVEQIEGIAKFNQDQFIIDMEKGISAKATLENGKIIINEIRDKDKVNIEIDLNLNGDATAALALLNDLEMDIANQPILLHEGGFAGNLNLTFPIIEILELTDINYIADLALSNIKADIEQPFFASIAAEKMKINVNNDQVKLQGSIAASLDQHPDPIITDFYLEENLSQASAHDFAQKITLSGILQETAINAFLPNISEHVLLNGKLAYILNSETAWQSEEQAIAAEIDFTNIALEIPAFGLKKPIEGLANMDLRANIDAAGQFSIHQLHYKSSKGDEVRGFANLNTNIYDFAPFKIGKQNLERLKFTINDENIEADIKGSLLDISYFLETQNSPSLITDNVEMVSPQKILDNKILDADDNSISDQLKDKGIILSLNTDELQFNDKAALPNFKGEVIYKNGFFEWINVTSKSQDNSDLLKVKLNRNPLVQPIITHKNQVITPIDGARQLKIMGQAISLLQIALDLEGQIEGGAFHIQAVETALPHKMSGILNIDAFKITDAPVMVKLLQTLSLTGILSALSDEGLEFASLNLHYDYENNLIEIHNSIADGFSMGMTGEGFLDLNQNQIDMKGVVIPAYGINQLVGALPIIGNLLTGINKEGIIATNYTMKGALNNPEISANPLSNFAPGIIRDIFGGIFGSSPERPNDSN